MKICNKNGKKTHAHTHRITVARCVLYHMVRNEYVISPEQLLCGVKRIKWHGIENVCTQTLLTLESSRT